jgi:hypothetical protein
MIKSLVYQDDGMKDVFRETIRIISLTEEVVTQCCSKHLEDLFNWNRILSKLDPKLTEPQLIRIDHILEDIQHKVNMLLYYRQYNFQEEHGTHQQGKYVLSAELVNHMIEKSKTGWLESVLKIEESVKFMAESKVPSKRQTIEKSMSSFSIP